MRRLSRGLLFILIVALIVGGVFAAASKGFAAFRPEINYQGKLTDSNNLAVADGNYYMTFRLYTTATGGTPIWTEAHVGTTTPVAVTNGLFTVMLGSITSLAGVNFDQPLWLEVAIGGTDGASWETLSPRKPLGAVPAAFVSQTAQTLDNLDSAQFLRSDTSDTFGGGTLTIDGSGALSVLGGATFSNATSSTFYTTTFGIGSDYLTDITGTGLAVAGGALSVTNVPASSLSLTNGYTYRGSSANTAEATSTLFVADSGNVGIGTTTPGALLDVQGAAQFGTGNVNLITSAGKIAGLSTTYFQTDTSANLAGIITDETGSGALVFGTSPTITTPTIGTSLTLGADTISDFTGTGLTVSAGALTDHVPASSLTSRTATHTAALPQTPRKPPPRSLLRTAANVGIRHHHPRRPS
ncbi:MAG: hypothetical protein KatS3mg099_319 [Candidatus Parcubacteria bacterium]|nr:MAG: hypothetical protein KatS3mg099_319 [Candidatus Parcubacteria bacterium]